MDPEKKEEIKRTILAELYRAWSHGTIISLSPLQDAHGWEENYFWTAIDELEQHQDFIKNHGSSVTYEIRPQGILYAEQHRIVPAEEVERQEDTRTRLLVALADDYEEHGTESDVTPQDLALPGVDSNTAYFNLELLEKIGYVRGRGMGYQISPRGLSAVADWKKRQASADEFDRISELSPAARGRALQKFIAQLLELQGWSQKEGVRTSHEEMDVLIFRAREYYLIECKWEKDAVEAGVVRELFGKLGNRIDVKGIVVSMSGFTAGAAEQAGNYAGQKVILLFGPEDVRSIIQQTTNFNDILNEKYDALITSRKLIWL